MQPFAEIWQNDSKRSIVCTDGYLPAPRRQTFFETCVRHTDLISTWPKVAQDAVGERNQIECELLSWIRTALGNPEWEFEDELELLVRGAPPSAPGRRKPTTVLPDMT